MAAKTEAKGVVEAKMRREEQVQEELDQGAPRSVPGPTRRPAAGHSRTSRVQEQDLGEFRRPVH